MNNTDLPVDLNGVKFHFVGIKGTGMVALVEILNARGAVITGSDGKIYYPAPFTGMSGNYFRCEYADGKTVPGGTNGVELPGDKLFDLYQEYVTLAADLKERKEALGLKPLISFEKGGSVTITKMRGEKKAVKEIVNTVKPKEATDKNHKEEVYKEGVKYSLKTEDTELYSIYCDWVDAIFANPKAGSITKAGAKAIVTEVERFCNGNRDAQIEIMKTLMINGWKSQEWGIDRYKRQHNLPDETVDTPYYCMPK